MRRRKMLRAGVAVTTVVLGAAGVGAAVLINQEQVSAAPKAQATDTVEVVRTDLVSRTEASGTLGYAGATPLLAAGQGTLTWLPEVGAEIGRGARAYEVDGHRVPLFYGTTPLWRALKTGVDDGQDVLEIERNLKALGYGDDLAVNREFTWATAEAIKDWQDDLGLAETGQIAPGDVVIQPGRLRIATVDGTLGGPANGKVATVTDTTRLVTVDLPVTEQELAKVGRRVQIELPGGRTTSGTVSEIGNAATSGSDDDGPIDPREDTDTATVPVYISLSEPSAAGRLDDAPVTVGFTGATRKKVLAVPVNALLAQSPGHYQVEVVDGTARRMIPVELGIFADGQVEVSGAGLDAGMRVEVPKS
jgi:peptidoglycan hydrolase-like protein with peptidoglycan-binding domain